MRVSIEHMDLIAHEVPILHLVVRSGRSVSVSYVIRLHFLNTLDRANAIIALPVPKKSLTHCDNLQLYSMDCLYASTHRKHPFFFSETFAMPVRSPIVLLPCTLI